MKSSYHLKIYRVNEYDTLPKLKFADAPHSNLNKHYIDILPIFIQLPRGIVKSDVTCKVLQVEFNNTDIILLKKFLINPIEEQIKETVYRNSKKWFDKTFTMNKIDNSLISKLSTSLELTVDPNTKFYNQFNSEINPKFISGVTLLPLIKLTNLEFIANKFTYHLVLEQAKVNIECVLDTYSIKDDITTISSAIVSS